MQYLLFPLLAVLGHAQVDAAQPIIVTDAQVKLISQVRVPAQEAGVLSALNVTEGDPVRQGEVLGAIDDRLVRFENEIAKLEHQIAKVRSENDINERYAVKSLAVSEAELKRAAEANESYQNSVSQTEIERLQMVVDRSTLSIEQAQLDQEVGIVTESLKDKTIQATDHRIAIRQIKSPLDGVVVEIYAQQGEWLEPGRPVLRVINMDRLRVEAHLDGKRYGRELQGRPVELTVSLPPDNQSRSFRGNITFVSPEVQPVNGEIRVWAEVVNEGGKLRPGDHGTLTINPSSSSDENRE